MRIDAPGRTTSSKMCPPCGVHRRWRSDVNGVPSASTIVKAVRAPLAPLFRMHGGELPCELVGLPQVVRVHERYISSSGCLERGVSSARRSSRMREVQDAHTRGLEAAQIGCRFLARAVVRDDQLPVRERLRENRVDGEPEERRTIVCRQDDRNRGHVRRDSAGAFLRIRSATDAIYDIVDSTHGSRSGPDSNGGRDRAAADRPRRIAVARATRRLEMLTTLASNRPTRARAAVAKQWLVVRS